MTLTEERLAEHDKQLNQHGESILQLINWDKDKHERLTAMEKKDEENEKRLKDVEQNYVKLENTILTENKETRKFFQSNMDKLWDLTKSRDEQKHEGRKMKHELAKTKLEKWSDVIFKVASSGGILYLIAQALLK